MKTPDQTNPLQPPLTSVGNTAVLNERARQRTILLVEDDRALRRYLEVILQKAGYTVNVAGDGLEAMKIVLMNPPDAVVTDAIMPQINGHELCRFLRRHAKLSHLPIILLSGLENNAAVQARDDGADIYLSKPVSPAELITCLERLL